MRYFLIAGEASGDLHAAHLIAALRQADAKAEFVGFGGDLMEAAGMRLLRHYSTWKDCASARPPSARVVRTR